MSTTMSRHQGTFARPAKTLAIAKPSKTPRSFDAPVSRVAAPPPELSDTSTIYSRHSSRQSGGTYSDISDDYESSYPNIDVMDQITDRMDKLWDPEPMDRIRDRQTKTSGITSAKARELDETKARLARRLQRTRVNFEDTVEQVSGAREDLKVSRIALEDHKARAARIDPDAYEEARRIRHSRKH